MALVGTAGEDAVLRVSIDTSKADSELEIFTGKAKQLFDQISRKWQEFADFLSRGGQAGDVFGNLKIGIDKASEATRGLISRFDLAVAANRAYAAGLRLTEEQLAALAVAAQKHAEATGGSAAEAMDRLTGSIARGSSRALREFGIDLEQNGNRLVKASDAVNALTQRFGGMTSEADDAGDSIDRLKNQYNDLRDAAAMAAANNSGLSHALKLFADTTEQVQKLIGALGGAGDKFSLFGSIVQGVIDAAMGPISVLGRMYQNLVGIRDTVMDLLGMAQGRGASITGDHTPEGPSLGPRLPSVSVAPAARPATPARSGGGGGRAQTEDPLYARVRREAEVQAQIAALQEQEIQASITRDNELTARQADAIRARTDAFLQGSEMRDRAGEAEYHGEMQRIAQRERAEERSVAMRKAAWERQVGAYEAYTGTLSGIAKQGADAFGASEGAKLVIAGITETVYAAIAWAKVANPFGGQAHIPEAVAHTAAAALAFAKAAELGASGRGGSSGSGGGAQSAAAAGPSYAGGGYGGGGMGGGGPVSFTVIVNAAGDVIDDGTYRRLGRVVSEASRRGYVRKAA